jgi:hypothetical protein
MVTAGGGTGEKTAPARHGKMDMPEICGLPRVSTLKKIPAVERGPPMCCASTAASKRGRGLRCATIGRKSYLERLAATRSAAWLRSLSSPGSCAVNI